MRTYQVIVIGSSTGGLQALGVILSGLPESFPIPVVIVQHLSPDSPGILAELLSGRTRIPVKEAEDKEPLRPGAVYVAPPNYHLLIERDATLSLSVDEKENHSRPSIDVLFESAADVFGEELVGVILTGANSDGSLGLKRIHDGGGLTIVQEPDTAEASAMPSSALKSLNPDHILTLERIAALLFSLGENPVKKASD